jgi:hypothetical protein
MIVGGIVMKPYICADSAFALSPSVMKYYEVANPDWEQFNLNYALTRTRRAVECSFGRFKQFPIVKNSRLPFLQGMLPWSCVLFTVSLRVRGCHQRK